MTLGAVLTRGLGRSYGDASLPPAGRSPVASTLGADRVLAFDEESGVLRAEAGLSVARIAELFFPRGFFVPVTPGTGHVTLGGLVAADVHGKNHHVAGTIGAHVLALRMRLPDGTIETLTDATHRELFRATLGGMGLTGHILDVTLALERVPSRHVVHETRVCPDLESLIDTLETAGASSPFTVAWADLMTSGTSFGRGTVLSGRWADAGEAAASRSSALPDVGVPFPMPEALLTDGTIAAYNRLRFEAARRADTIVREGRRGATAFARIGPAEPFFWPLDAIGNWNLLYGRRGLTQYQCVLPRDATMRSYRRLAEAAREGGPGPFLAVIKDFGDEGRGLLSFPMPGVTFALDFPVHDGIAARVARLNDLVAEAGGRIYLAKDAFTTAAQFAAMEPRLPAFLELRRRLDPDEKITSALSVRLLGDTTFPPR